MKSCVERAKVKYLQIRISDTWLEHGTFKHASLANFGWHISFKRVTWVVEFDFKKESRVLSVKIVFNLHKCKYFSRQLLFLLYHLQRKEGFTFSFVVCVLLSSPKRLTFNSFVIFLLASCDPWSTCVCSCMTRNTGKGCFPPPSQIHSIVLCCVLPFQSRLITMVMIR